MNKNLNTEDVNPTVKHPKDPDEPETLTLGPFPS